MSFSMVGMHGAMFPTIDFLAHQILSILESQIETEKIFSLVGILINLMKCLQLNNLGKLILWKKNWPIDHKVGCKSPFNLVELMKKGFKLRKGVSKVETFIEIVNI
jgi:hypothetical protein